MPTEKKSTKTVTPIDIDALVEERFNADKEALRLQVLEEQLSELLQREALKKATLTEFLEQLKSAGKDLWGMVSAKPLLEITRVISGVDRLEKRLKSHRRTRRSSLTTAEFDEIKTKLLAILKSSTEPQTIGQLSKALSLEPNILKSIVLKLRASKEIISQGEKRSTRYISA